MERLKRMMNSYYKYQDAISLLLGVALIVLLILIKTVPGNKLVLLGAFLLGGLLNISNGLKFSSDQKKKNLGRSSIMLGVIIIFLGMVIYKIY